MSIIAITGTTGSGKTALAIKTAQEQDGEIINCDSRQIYTSLDIITGKDISDKNFKRVARINNNVIGYYTVADSTKIWLYDLVTPDRSFSSYDYQNCALYVLRDILSRKKTAIICGGTYFYLQHLLYSIGSESVKPDWELRNSHKNKQTVELQKILIQKSPVLFGSLNESDRNNPQRLIRKIEIAESGKKNLAVNMFDVKILAEKLGIPDINYQIIGLRPKNAEFLENIISKRVSARLQEGAVAEVKRALTRYGETAPGLKTIGCIQIIKYLKSELELHEAVAEWITKEKQYAKRQITFMKKNSGIKWHYIG